jgi:hypothetical protein
MTLVLRDRVKETTTTTGTGTYTLAGAVNGFETFGSVGNSNTTYYGCSDGTNFEIGIGTYTSSGTTLARTAILQSSNSDNAVSWGSGTKTIFCTLPAEKMSFLDASGNIVAANGSALTALNASNLGSGTVANARLDAQLQDVAGLAVTNGNFIVGDGSNFVAESGATARSSLGLGTAATTAATDYATAAQGAKADAALPKAGGAMTGAITTNSTFDGRDVGTDGTKLDGIESSADVTDAGNVNPLVDSHINQSTANSGQILSWNGSDYAWIAAGGGGDLLAANNLSDVGSASSARTNLGLGTSAVLNTGISNTNVPKFTSGVADDDFLRVSGTAIEGRSASEVLADIGGQASLTFGISNTNAVKVDSTSVADDEYARFTANGLESRSTSEVLSDIGAITASSSDTLTNKTIDASQLSGTVANARLDAQLQDVAGLAVTNGNFIVGDGSNFVAESGATARTSLGLGAAAVLDTGISNTNVPKFTSGVADDDFLRVAGTAIEGRSASEVLSDIGGQASLTFGISNTNAVKVDSSSVADDEYARFTANGLESRSTAEVLSDIGAQASLTFGISNTNAVKVDSSSVTDDEYARFTANGLESRSSAETRSDIGLGSAAVLTAGTSANNAVQLDGSARLPAVDGSQLTNLPSAGATAGFAVAMAIAL